LLVVLPKTAKSVGFPYTPPAWGGYFPLFFTGPSEEPLPQCFCLRPRPLSRPAPFFGPSTFFFQSFYCIFSPLLLCAFSLLLADFPPPFTMIFPGVTFVPVPNFQAEVGIKRNFVLGAKMGFFLPFSLRQPLRFESPFPAPFLYASSFFFLDAAEIRGVFFAFCHRKLFNLISYSSPSIFFAVYFSHPFKPTTNTNPLKKVPPSPSNVELLESGKRYHRPPQVIN